MRPHGARGATPGQRRNTRCQLAGVCAAEPAPDCHIRPAQARNTGHITNRYNWGKATEGPLLIPALRHSNTAIAEPTAPRNTRPRSLALNAAHEVIRALGLQSRGGDPPHEDTDTDSNLEGFRTAPKSGAPAGPTPPAGSIQALCPA